MPLPTLRESVESIRRDLDSRRFRGEDPALPIAPDDAPPAVIAKLLASQASHALLLLDSGPYNPDEEAAEKRFYAGLALLDAWCFRDARRLFDEAAKRAREPLLQQRITLYRLLVDLLKEAITAEPERGLSVAHRDAVVEALGRFDLMASTEREHFLGEVARLVDLRSALKSEPFLHTAWLLVQARIAMDSSEGASGITWLLAAAHLNREALRPSPYLRGLLDRARNRILRLIGEAVPEPASPEPSEPVSDEAPAAAAAPKPEAKPSGSDAKPAGSDEKVRPWDLYDALSAALEAAFGRDPRAATRLFRIRRYVEPAGEGDADV